MRKAFLALAGLLMASGCVAPGAYVPVAGAPTVVADAGYPPGPTDPRCREYRPEIHHPAYQDPYTGQWRDGGRTPARCIQWDPAPVYLAPPVVAVPPPVVYGHPPVSLNMHLNLNRLFGDKGGHHGGYRGHRGHH